MDKIINQSGGMPLKVTDFEFTHEVYKGAFEALINGLNGAANCVLSGLIESGSTTRTISAGYYYYGGEIYYVPTASFTYDVAKSFYITQVISSADQRTFKNGTPYYCHQLRRYAISYATTSPSGGILLSSIPRLETIIDTKTQSVIGSAMMGTGSSVTYASGFTANGSYAGVQVYKNAFGDVNFIAAFNSEAATSGKVFTLPANNRPIADIASHFYAYGTMGIMKIKTNGEVYVVGASTSGVNYINFTFNINQVNLVGYAIPISGGGSGIS